MDKHIIAVGGGGFGRSGEGYKIEKYIISFSKTSKPNICFIPTASGDNDSYKVSFYNTFTRLGCNPSHIDFFKRTVDLKDHIDKQDIIYVGGGNTKSMLAVWKDWNLDVILKSAYENGVIMSGVSAGAICWFEKGITDSWSNQLEIIKCLNFVEGICCPHYDEEPSRKPYVKRLIESASIPSCIAIEGDCALHIKNGLPLESISFGENKNSFTVQLSEGQLVNTNYNSIRL
tara:strand:+ start:1442 stop:2134 length:693 start_codon:yes stop_codon:yes gene_type:complete